MAAPFGERHRRDLERWAAEGDEVSQMMLDTGLGFPEALEACHRRLAGPVPVPDPDTEWR